MKWFLDNAQRFKELVAENLAATKEAASGATIRAAASVGLETQAHELLVGAEDANAKRAHDLVKARAHYKSYHQAHSGDENFLMQDPFGGTDFPEDVRLQVLDEREMLTQGGRRKAIEADYEKKLAEHEKTKNTDPSYSTKEPLRPLVVKVAIGGSGDAAWRTKCAISGALDDQAMAAHKNETGRAKTVYYARDKELTWDFSGPSAPGTNLSLSGKVAGGGSDTGSNSIGNLAQEIPDFIEKMIDEALGKEKDRELIILVKGHSRGGVAAGFVAKALKDRYKGATVELVQVDPVPGPLQETPFVAGDRRQVDVGELDESTVVYSIFSGHGVSFNPQAVLGARRIIISPQAHGVSIQNGFIYQGRLYKGSNLNSLPEGVYRDDSSDISRPGEIHLIGDRELIQKAFVGTYNAKYPPRSADAKAGYDGKNFDKSWEGDRKENVEKALERYLNELDDKVLKAILSEAATNIFNNNVVLAKE